jgi:hypothetical protein
MKKLVIAAACLSIMTGSAFAQGMTSGMMKTGDTGASAPMNANAKMKKKKMKKDDMSKGDMDKGMGMDKGMDKGMTK